MQSQHTHTNIHTQAHVLQEHTHLINTPSCTFPLQHALLDFIWSCTGARCCVQSNPSICTNLRNGGPEMKKEWTIQGPG